MADRDPIPSDFIGKTITEFDGSAINAWRFGPAGYGMVVCEECAA